jgi:hypothetical protein
MGDTTYRFPSALQWICLIAPVFSHDQMQRFSLPLVDKVNSKNNAMAR